jgi:hypothetical protein
MQACTAQEAMEAALHGPVASVAVDTVALLTAARDRPCLLVLNPRRPGWMGAAARRPHAARRHARSPACKGCTTSAGRPSRNGRPEDPPGPSAGAGGRDPTGRRGWCRPERAREALTDALATFRELGDLQDAAMALTQLATWTYGSGTPVLLGPS